MFLGFYRKKKFKGCQPTSFNEFPYVRVRLRVFMSSCVVQTVADSSSISRWLFVWLLFVKLMMTNAKKHERLWKQNSHGERFLLRLILLLETTGGLFEEFKKHRSMKVRNNLSNLPDSSNSLDKRLYTNYFPLKNLQQALF
jgi:hypothetical protein